MTKGKNIETFGQRLRKARRDKGLTQAQLAELSGISRRAIVHYENYGKRPPVDKLKKLSEVIGVSADILIGINEDEKNHDADISYNLAKRLRIIEQLPLRDQKAIFQYINTIVQKHKLKEELKHKK